MEKFYSINKTSKILDVTPQTLRNWDANGYFKPHHTGSNGYRYYSETQINNLVNQNSTDKKYIGYCRVSTNTQKDDLNRQVENLTSYLNTLNHSFEIITDIGSGINYNKKGLQKLITMINNKEVSKIYVLYKDRLLRFGFELVEYFAKINDCEIVILDNIDKTKEQELVEDLMQIITVFSCRLHGSRAKHTKQLLDNLNEDTDYD